VSHFEEWVDNAPRQKACRHAHQNHQRTKPRPRKVLGNSAVAQHCSAGDNSVQRSVTVGFKLSRYQKTMMRPQVPRKQVIRTPSQPQALAVSAIAEHVQHAICQALRTAGT
jgi:hypothetical protein